MNKRIFPMGEGAKVTRTELTEKDPFVNFFDDNSYKMEHAYNTAEEAATAVPDKWKAGTKQLRVSEINELVKELEETEE